jgi:triosephosphate isomerase
MNVGPVEAREYLRAFFAAGEIPRERSVWFFPPALTIESVAQGVAGHRNVLVGAQDIYWESKGAFTGAISGPLAQQAGARLTLIGHSERRHVFGETDEETGKKVRQRSPPACNRCCAWGRPWPSARREKRCPS